MTGVQTCALPISYTLTETRPADGYALADEITFRLLKKADENGNDLQEAEVYYLPRKPSCSGRGMIGNCWTMQL